MNASLIVQLDGQAAGVLTRLRGGRLRFDYEDSYRSSRHATPLSVSMPTQIRSHPDHVVTPWLWNLLPDNDAVLDRWARQFQVSASSPFSLLTTPVGLDCAGGVRFVSPEQTEQEISQHDDVTWLTAEEVAQRLRDLRSDSTAWLGSSFTGQFSLAGAQAKTALLYRQGRWGVPHGAAATTHILKPAAAGLDDHDLNEHLCLDAARRAGLVAARTHVAVFAGETAIVVERYDRRDIDGQVLRIHQEDLCQALGFPPSQKYQNEGGPGPADIAELLRGVMSPRNSDLAVAQFFDALVWNWLIGGTDAHAKNYSLLLAGDQVRLAPLYDIASALPYGTHERKLKLAMKTGGDYPLLPLRNSWGKAAGDMGIDRDFALGRVRQLTGSVTKAFAAAAAAPAVADLGRELPGRLARIVADRAARCARVTDPD